MAEIKRRTIIKGIGALLAAWAAGETVDAAMSSRSDTRRCQGLKEVQPIAARGRGNTAGEVRVLGVSVGLLRSIQIGVDRVPSWRDPIGGDLRWDAVPERTVDMEIAIPMERFGCSPSRDSIAVLYAALSGKNKWEVDFQDATLVLSEAILREYHFSGFIPDPRAAGEVNWSYDPSAREWPKVKLSLSVVP